MLCVFVVSFYYALMFDHKLNVFGFFLVYCLFHSEFCIHVQWGLYTLLLFLFPTCPCMFCNILSPMVNGWCGVVCFQSWYFFCAFWICLICEFLLFCFSGLKFCLMDGIFVCPLIIGLGMLWSFLEGYCDSWVVRVGYLTLFRYIFFIMFFMVCTHLSTCPLLLG